MKMTLLRSLVAATLLAFGAQAKADVLAYDNFGGDDLNLVSLTGEESYGSPGDGFQEYNSGDSAPFALIDASVGTFPGDSLGIIVDAPDGSYDPAFGAVDVVNGDNPDGIGTAVWTFDVTGASDLTVSFDFAAMGDFESSNDSWTIDVAVDGSILETFTTTIDEAGALNYTLADSSVVNLSDPMLLNGTVLSNVFTTFTTGNLGSGDTVTLTLSGGGDGGSEAIALDSIVVEGTTTGAVPEPGSFILVMLGAALAGMIRLRRVWG